jgi:hypothetical protein
MAPAASARQTRLPSERKRMAPCSSVRRTAAPTPSQARSASACGKPNRLSAATEITAKRGRTASAKPGRALVRLPW